MGRRWVWQGSSLALALLAFLARAVTGGQVVECPGPQNDAERTWQAMTVDQIKQNDKYPASPAEEDAPHYDQ